MEMRNFSHKDWQRFFPKKHFYCILKFPQIKRATCDANYLLALSRVSIAVYSLGKKFDCKYLQTTVSNDVTLMKNLLTEKYVNNL